MNRIRFFLALGALILVFAGCDHDNDEDCVLPAAVVNYGPAGAPPQLIDCESYVVLSGTGVNCTGSNVIVTGDIGCSPSGNVNGLPPGQPTKGSKHERDTSASHAQTSCRGAYEDLCARSSNGTLTGVNLGGRRFSAGVYTFTTNCTVDGPLTLDGHNNPNAVFVFQVTGSLVCASNSTIVLVNGAQARNVYWQCGSSATIGNNGRFHGTLIAQQNIDCRQGSKVRGRVLSRNGSVSLNDCSVERP